MFPNTQCIKTLIVVQVRQCTPPQLPHCALRVPVWICWFIWTWKVKGTEAKHLHIFTGSKGRREKQEIKTQTLNIGNHENQRNREDRESTGARKTLPHKVTWGRRRAEICTDIVSFDVDDFTRNKNKWNLQDGEAAETLRIVKEG